MVKNEHTFKDLFKSKTPRNIYELLKKEPLKKEIEVNFNIFEWYAFKELLINFCLLLQNNRYSSGSHKSKNQKNTYYQFTISDIKDMSCLIDYNDEKINNIIKRLTLTDISIDIRKFNKIIIEVYQVESKNPKLDDVLNNNIETFFNRVVDRVNEMIKNVKNAEYVDSGLFSYIGIEKCNIEGYYNSKYIEIDAGKKSPIPGNHEKKIKMHYKFKNMYVIDSLMNKKNYIYLQTIYQPLIENILQLFIQGNFCSINKLNYYPFDEDISIKNDFDFYKEKVGKICEYNYDFTNQKLPNCSYEDFSFPQEAIDKAIDKAILLDNIALNTFFYSCQSYKEALKSSVSYFHYYIALENIIKYEKNNKNNEISVKELVKKYTKVNFDGILEWCYTMRNKYAHNGITNKGIFNSFFKESYPIIGYEYDSYEGGIYIEALIKLITSYTLISWLLDT